MIEVHKIGTTLKSAFIWTEKFHFWLYIVCSFLHFFFICVTFFPFIFFPVILFLTVLYNILFSLLIFSIEMKRLQRVINTCFFYRSTSLYWFNGPYNRFKLTLFWSSRCWSRIVHCSASPVSVFVNKHTEIQCPRRFRLKRTGEWEHTCAPPPDIPYCTLSLNCCKKESARAYIHIV